MVVNIFFSIFSNPAKAYASVCGEYEIDPPPKPGDQIQILPPKSGEWFAGSLRVESITDVAGQQPHVELQTLVALSADDAYRIGKRMEDEAKFFCDTYA